MVAGHARGRRLIRDRARPGRFGRAWAVSFLLLFALQALWGVATPIGASPDEPSHLVHAAAVVRGQWIGDQPHDPHLPPSETAVRVPVAFVTLHGPIACYLGHPDTPAGCVHRTAPEGTGTVVGYTYVGHYPPLYYLAVGWPSLLDRSVSGIYGMRLASAAVTAGFVALALATARRWSASRLLPAAIGFAATPLVVFLGGTVNPSGLEITAAICAWTALGVLVIEHPADPPPGLLAVLATSSVVLVLSRSAAPLWPVLMAGAALPMVVGRTAPQVWHRRAVRRAAGSLAVGYVLAGTWIAAGRGLTFQRDDTAPAGATDLAVLRHAVGQLRGWVVQSTGRVGWLDTNPPRLAEVIWIAGWILVVGLGLLVARRRLRPVIVGLGAGAVVIPVALSYSQARHSGYFDQARYYLPLAVGTCVWAGVAAGARSGAGTRWLARLLAVAYGLGQAAVFVWALRRYLVGARGSLSPFATAPQRWTPPWPAWTLDLLAIVVCALLATWLVALASDPSPLVAADTPAPDQPDHRTPVRATRRARRSEAS